MQKGLNTKVVNRHFEEFDVYIGRGTIWGNPFIQGIHGNHNEVIELYREYAKNNPEILKHLEVLRGKRLGCSCKPNTCHGDVLVEMLNERSKMPKYERIIIGIDESYTNTGISIAADGILIKVSSTMKRFAGLKNKTEKRNCIKQMLRKILEVNKDKAKEIQIIVERMRSFSSNNTRSGSIKYVKATAALIASIVDAAYEFDVPVFSVDTRSWKGQIVGSTKTKSNKYGIDEKKWPTILHVKKLGFNVSYTTKTGKLKFDDDAADSACIALYGFIPQKTKKLLREE